MTGEKDAEASFSPVILAQLQLQAHTDSCTSQLEQAPTINGKQAPYRIAGHHGKPME